MDPFTVPTTYWHQLPDGRVQCDVCPHACKLRDGQRGVCFVRARHGEGVVLTSYGRSSGFCVDPIEKKPLNHFLPGSAVFSFGTAGCNLACRFCQNWDISKSKEIDTLADAASPTTIARRAADLGCRSVAFTYNDPTIFMEYAIDVADACHDLGLAAVAVTAGYMCPEPRAEFFAHIDAANVDLKGFTDEFYKHTCGAELGAVLDTLVYLRHETAVWFELTTLLIPGMNDSDAELGEMTAWVVERLGPDVPMHFTAFHPDYRMLDRAPTPQETLTRARRIALANGVRHAYTGNVHDADGASTYCHGCGARVIGRDWYELGEYRLDDAGHCAACGAAVPGVFDGPPGEWGRRRQPVVIDRGGPVMAGVRPAAVAGSFYPAAEPALREAIEAAFADSRPLVDGAFTPRAIIVPHAGYRYSGGVAASAYRWILGARSAIRRVLLLGPCHRVFVRGMAVPGVDTFETPLGQVRVDVDARNRARPMPGVVVDDRAHEAEHSLEVQLPFLQTVLDDFSVLPVAVGDAPSADVAALIAALWDDPELLVVVSTDLSHYHRYTVADRLDAGTASVVVAMQPDAIEDADACARPLRGLLEAAAARRLGAQLIDLRNSGDTGGDRERVVGYGAFVVG